MLEDEGGGERRREMLIMEYQYCSQTLSTNKQRKRGRDGQEGRGGALNFVVLFVKILWCKVLKFVKIGL